ncbi:MAG: dienelactone hydrolase family protein [Pseudomonadota bacterium]
MSQNVGYPSSMESRDNLFKSTRLMPVMVPYRTYLPDGYSEDSKPFPLLIYLHGSGECGTDLNLLEKAGLPRFLKEGLDLPFVVICPQCRLSWEPDDLTVLLDHVVEGFNVDQTRLYLCGVSLGAMGTWMFSNRVANRLAAIVPVCGPAVRIDPAGYAGLAVRVIHGAMDSTVPIGESVKMVRALRNAGIDVTFDVHADVDHDVWNHCFDTALTEWLLAHRREPE